MLAVAAKDERKGSKKIMDREFENPPKIRYNPPASYSEIRREAEALFQLALARERELYDCLCRIEELELSLQSTHQR